MPSGNYPQIQQPPPHRVSGSPLQALSCTATASELLFWNGSASINETGTYPKPTPRGSVWVSQGLQTASRKLRGSLTPRAQTPRYPPPCNNPELGGLSTIHHLGHGDNAVRHEYIIRCSIKKCSASITDQHKYFKEVFAIHHVDWCLRQLGRVKQKQTTSVQRSRKCSGAWDTRAPLQKYMSQVSCFPLCQEDGLHALIVQIGQILCDDDICLGPQFHQDNSVRQLPLCSH